MNKLTKWTRPSNYAGKAWPEYFVFLGQNRDSDSLTRSNFACALLALGGESETVIVVRERHWAVGWVEWIAIHESDETATNKARGILTALDRYPVVNEDHLSELEWDEAQDYWASLSLCERINLCADAGVSIFAARHAWIPQQDNGYLFERLSG